MAEAELEKVMSLVSYESIPDKNAREMKIGAMQVWKRLEPSLHGKVFYHNRCTDYQSSDFR